MLNDFNKKTMVVSIICGSLTLGASIVRADSFPAVVYNHLSSGSLLLAEGEADDFAVIDQASKGDSDTASDTKKTGGNEDTNTDSASSQAGAENEQSKSDSAVNGSEDEDAKTPPKETAASTSQPDENSQTDAKAPDETKGQTKVANDQPPSVLQPIPLRQPTETDKQIAALKAEERKILDNREGGDFGKTHEEWSKINDKINAAEEAQNKQEFFAKYPNASQQDFDKAKHEYYIYNTEKFNYELQHSRTSPDGAAKSVGGETRSPDFVDFIRNKK